MASILEFRLKLITVSQFIDFLCGSVCVSHLNDPADNKLPPTFFEFIATLIFGLTVNQLSLSVFYKTISI